MSVKTVSTAKREDRFDGKSEDRVLAASVRTSFVGRVCGISVLLPGCQRGAGVVEYLEKQCRQFQCRKKSLCVVYMAACQVRNLSRSEGDSLGSGVIKDSKDSSTSKKLSRTKENSRFFS